MPTELTDCESKLKDLLAKYAEYEKSINSIRSAQSFVKKEIKLYQQRIEELKEDQTSVSTLLDIAKNSVK